MQSSNLVLMIVGMAALGANLVLDRLAATIAGAIRHWHDRRSTAAARPEPEHCPC